MKTHLLTALIALFISLSSIQAYAASCAEGRGFTLICRGNYSVQNGGAVTGTAFLDFIKAPNAAGADGASLSAGSCAWEDRALNSNEPTRVHHSISITNAGSEGWFDLVSQCAFDTNCTIEICVATNSSGTLLETMSNQAVIRFP